VTQMGQKLFRIPCRRIGWYVRHRSELHDCSSVPRAASSRTVQPTLQQEGQPRLYEQVISDVTAITVNATRGTNHTHGATRGKTTLRHSRNTKMTTAVTTNIFHRGGAGAVRPGNSNQVSSPLTRRTFAVDIACSLLASSLALVDDLSHRARASGVLKRYTTCQSSPA